MSVSADLVRATQMFGEVFNAESRLKPCTVQGTKRQKVNGGSARQQHETIITEPSACFCRQPFQMHERYIRRLPSCQVSFKKNNDGLGKRHVFYKTWLKTTYHTYKATPADLLSSEMLAVPAVSSKETMVAVTAAVGSLNAEGLERGSKLSASRN